MLIAIFLIKNMYHLFFKNTHNKSIHLKLQTTNRHLY
jgi:hypothetical protein